MRYFTLNEQVVDDIALFFIFISFSLFLKTKYFPLIEIIMFFFLCYYAYISYKEKYKTIYKLIKSKFTIWYVGFWGYTVMVTLFNNVGSLMVLVKTIIVFSVFLIIFIFSIRNNLDNISKEIVRVTKVISLIVCAWLFINEGQQLFLGKRIGFSAFGHNPNNIGTILGIFSIIIIYDLYTNKCKKDIIIYMIVAFFIILTGSKKAIILLFIGWISFIFEDNKIMWRRVFLLGAFSLFVIILSLTIPSLYEYIGRRFLSLLGGIGLINFKADNSTTLRVNYMKEAVDLWFENPIFGGGYDNFLINSGLKTYSHNNYLELLSSTGIIGFIIYYISYLKVIFKLSRKLTSEHILYILILVGILITDVGSVTYYIYPFYYIILFISYNILKKENYGEINGK